MNIGQMVDYHFEHGAAATVASLPIERREVKPFGVLDIDASFRIRNFVEKPDPDQAPSNLAVIGRYVFAPEIFDCLDQTPPGRNGEIQLTDAISLLMKDQPVLGYVIRGGRFDVGTKIDYLKAIVELALVREDLGPEFLSLLKEIVSRYDDTPPAPSRKRHFGTAFSEIAHRLERKPSSKHD
jgi:UTP--glucose-1-phosphate uridylyltransferase